MILAFDVVEAGFSPDSVSGRCRAAKRCFSTIEKPLLVDGFPAALRQKQGFFFKSQKVNEMLPMAAVVLVLRRLLLGEAGAATDLPT